MQAMKLAVLGVLLGKIVFGAEEREIEVQLTVPDGAWQIAIDSVHQVSNELWVVSTVSREPQAVGAQVITTVKAAVRVRAGALPVKHFVLGKTWGWPNREQVTFIKERALIEKDLHAGQALYRRAGLDHFNVGGESRTRDVTAPK